MKLVCYCACFATMLIGTKFIHCSNLTQVEALYYGLFDQYKRNFFPVFNYNNTVNISVDAGIVNINNFDELSGKIDLALSFDFRWVDERLKWEPSYYGGKSTLLVPPEEIWHPQLYLIESYDVVQEISNTSVLLRLFSSGKIIWGFGKVLKLVCSVDVTYFPFDSQTCAITVSGWAYRRNEVSLFTLNSVVHTDIYSQNSQWHLKSATIRNFTSTNDDFPPSVEIVLTLKRRNEFFVVYIIIPVIFLGSLNNLVFILPASSGERTSVAVTTFLSFIVFMEMLNGNVPESSAPMAYIYYYLLFLMIYSSAILCLCILSLRIYDKEEEISAIVKHVIRYLRFYDLLCRKRSNADLPLRKTSTLSKTPHEGTSRNASVTADRITSELHELSWKQIGKTFDAYCFLFLSLTFWFTTVISMYRLYYNFGL